jgi:hypothetical protein
MCHKIFVSQGLNEEVTINEVCVQAIVELQEDVSLIFNHDRVFVDGLKELVLLNVAFLIRECRKDTGMLDLLELNLVVELIPYQVNLIHELVIDILPLASLIWSSFPSEVSMALDVS